MREKLKATLEEHLPDAEERSFVEPRLANLLGLEDGATGDRQDLFAAWRLLFERLADTGPTVLAFEDMHWADAGLLDFVEYLLESSRDYPLYVITLARPELQERRPGWGAAQRNFTSLYLEALANDVMEELLDGLAPGLPARLRDQILARAEGVPLYAMETVRMLLDRGLLVRDGTVYRPTGEVETLEVPETLHALIAARLDGVSPEERRVLQDGAVLGKTFTKAALSALSGLSEIGSGAAPHVARSQGGPGRAIRPTLARAHELARAQSADLDVALERAGDGAVVASPSAASTNAASSDAGHRAGHVELHLRDAGAGHEGRRRRHVELLGRVARLARARATAPCRSTPRAPPRAALPDSSFRTRSARTVRPTSPRGPRSRRCRSTRSARSRP